MAKPDYIRTQMSVYSDYDYNSKENIKKALENMTVLYSNAEHGNTSAHAVLIDLQTALGKYTTDELMSVVTKKQRQVIILHLVYGYSQDEVAEMLGISQQAVSLRLMSGIRRIQRFLLTGRTGWTEWEDEEIEFLFEHYRAKGARWCAKQLGRTIQEVQSKVKRLRKQGFIV